MKKSLITSTLAFAGGLLGMAENSRPNFVFVMLDDVGPGWIPPYAERLMPEDMDANNVASYRQWKGKAGLDLDRHIKTAREAMPALAALADNGVVFDRAFATASLCGPSRAGLLTGTFQQRWRIYDNTDIEQTGLPEPFPCLAQVLKQAGYECGMIGKWHIGRKDPAVAGTPGYSTSAIAGEHPLDQGFSYYFGYNYHAITYYESDGLWENRNAVPKRPAGEFLTELFNDKAMQFVANALNRKSPFLLYYSPMSNHGPLDPPPDHYTDQFNSGTRNTDQFAGHLLAVDNILKQLAELLKQNGQLDNTVFVFSSDNGQPGNVLPANAPFKGSKGTGWIGGLRVPLIISGGAVQRRGMTTDVVSLADIFPTFMDFAGIPLPENIDGKSLHPFLTKQTEKAPRAHLPAAGLHATRWSFSFDIGERNRQDSTQCPLFGALITPDDVLLIRTATRPGLYKRFPAGIDAFEELFQFTTDPMLIKNAAGNYPEKTQCMRSELHAWLETVSPPALNHEARFEELLELTK